MERPGGNRPALRARTDLPLPPSTTPDRPIAVARRFLQRTTPLKLPQDQRWRYLLCLWLHPGPEAVR